MESCCWRSLFYIAVVCIATVSARDGDNTTTNDTKMYEPCVNATCPMPRCRPVALDFTSIPTEVYSRDNVICLNQTGPRTPVFNLTGCPDTFSSTMERIEGVCTNKTSQGIDLFMTLSQMVVGLYDFTCFSQRNSRRIFRSNYAIIVNGTDAYRDVLVFVNGISKRTANVCINEGDNLTIVARAVGEVTKVEVVYLNATGFIRGANETRVSCDTGFPCGSEYSDDSLDNRDQLCTLIDAASSTDNQTLRFFVQYNVTGQTIMTKLGEVNITVYPPTPSTTSTITNSPTPTGSPTNEDNGGTNEVVPIVVAVVLVLVVLAIVTLGLCLCAVYHWKTRKSSRQEDHTGDKSSPDGSLRKLRVLIYSCDHSNINPLVNKLKGKQEFEVEELIDDPSSQLSDNVSKLHSEISHGSVLIDCSCPGGTHTTMHTVVKSYTQKPSGDPDSRRWQIIQLNNCGTDVEIDPSYAWSKLYDHVEVMDYHTLDDVVDHVERKLIEYSHNRTSSIHSENEYNVSMKQQLLPGEELRPVGASAHKTTIEQVDNNQILEKVEGLAQGIQSLTAQSTSQHKELITSVEHNKELTETMGTQLDAIGQETRALVNHQND